MRDEILYMLGIVAVGFFVNYGLRALPFLLFAGKGRALPRWVQQVGDYLSPVIIALLVIYAYSGLAWRTAWPYLAGVLTVGLQLWKRNALASIVAGTLLYMCLLTTGCATSHAVPQLDAKNPSISVTTQGIACGNVLLKPEEVVDILEDYDVPKTRTVHILLAPEVRNLSEARHLMAVLAKAGYRRPILVTKRHATSELRPKSTEARSK